MSKTLDFSEVSPNAKSSTKNEPNYPSLHKMAPIKKEQIKKANAFLKPSKIPKYASTVHATLQSMALVMVKLMEASNEPTTASLDYLQPVIQSLMSNHLKIGMPA